MFEQQISELLQVIKTALVSGGEVIKEQFPILCHQLVMWGMISNALGVVLFTVLTGICFFVFMYGRKKYDPDSYDNTCADAIMWGSAVVAFLSFLFTCGCALDFTKSLVAPNLYIIEHLGSVVTSKG